MKNLIEDYQTFASLLKEKVQQAEGDIDIEQLVENLNEILGESIKKYHYLNIFDDDFITFNSLT